MPIGNLGYIGVSASNLGAWTRFGRDFLGVMVVEESAERVRFRIDEQAWRISVEPGSADDLAYVGFEVPGPRELAEMQIKLTEAGVACEQGSAELTRERGVSGLITCSDPDGLRIEIYWGAIQAPEKPFVSQQGVSGFVTEDEGLGHIVIGMSNIDAGRHFYCDVLGFGLSDLIAFEPRPGIVVELEFLHCNPRHHTVAIAPQRMPGRRLAHVMLQTKTLDDVGMALDRAEVCGVPISASLGKHTNDHMVSFYAVTPSGFEVEYGHGARNVDDGTWRSVRHTKTSVWGHRRTPPPPPPQS